MKRCEWSNGNLIYEEYHDHEWGVVVHDDRLLFEMLTLEGAQAGLNWLTVLKKRDNYRKAFDNFNITKVAAYDEKKYNQLLTNPGIIRNKLKIKSTISNAKNVLTIQKEYGSFDLYIWNFINNKPIINSWKNISQIPVTSFVSDIMSKDMKKRGFKFTGSTILYAYMQAIGMINDHTTDCFRYKELSKPI